MPTLMDASDSALLARRVAAWNAIDGPRVGDWCRMPDGGMRRIAYSWPQGMQTTNPDFAMGSFYFGDGRMTYSGGLAFGIILWECVLPTNETHPGSAWFFHHDRPEEAWFFHDRAEAHNGIEATVDCRVFEVRP